MVGRRHQEEKERGYEDRRNTSKIKEVRKLYKKIEAKIDAQLERAEKLSMVKVVFFSIAVFFCCVCAAIKLKPY